MSRFHLSYFIVLSHSRMYDRALQSTKVQHFYYKSNFTVDARISSTKGF